MFKPSGNSRITSIRIAILLCLCLFFLFFLAERANAQANVEIRVAAAADLTQAFGEIARVYERQTGQKVTLIFGSSGQLTQQIANGAPFDLFASASETYIDQLDKQGLLVPATRQRYARGKLILWTPADGPPLPKDLAELTAPRYRHIAIANPDHAPYGLAARQALQAAGVWDRIQAKLVIGENIQQTYQFASTGNADIALISRALINPDSTAKTGQQGHIKPVSDRLYAPLVQAMAVLKASSHREQGEQFVRFVLGAEGQKLLKRYGFEKP